MVLYIPVGAGADMSNILCIKEALSGGSGTWKSCSVCCFSYSSLYPSLPAYLAHTCSSSFLMIILLDIILVLMSDYLLLHLEKTAFPKLFSGTVN